MENYKLISDKISNLKREIGSLVDSPLYNTLLLLDDLAHAVDKDLKGIMDEQARQRADQLKK
jgi:5-bromo-4-chloroindolyl phosphate hydrolysis protein